MNSNMVKIGGLYEQTSKKTGKIYLTGRFGFGAKLLILPNADKSKPDAPENTPHWNVFVVPIDEPKT